MYEHLRDVRRCDLRGVLRHVPDRPISVGLRTPAFGADTTGEREVPDRHVVRGPMGPLVRGRRGQHLTFIHSRSFDSILTHTK